LGYLPSISLFVVHVRNKGKLCLQYVTKEMGYRKWYLSGRALNGR